VKQYLPAAVILVALAGAGALTEEDIRGEQQLYCDMVQLFENSKGEHGWPDYQQARQNCGYSENK
jgi:hypothetical protein